jgi:beta-phosphoglucomutase-like phosphatase (HAD superfamily)
MVVLALGLHAVLFDFDGVLCNSEPLHFLAFHEVLAAEKIELPESEYYEEMIGFDDRGAFRTSSPAVAASSIPRRFSAS